jgi:hypothetical protein
MMAGKKMGDEGKTGGGHLDKAVAELAAGRWERAHALVQDDESKAACWLHGIVHTMEGDLSNARYWYRRAGRAFPGADAVQAEIDAIRHALAAAPEA